jgi:RNA polymerase sigma factor (sigma-70 family)
MADSDRGLVDRFLRERSEEAFRRLYDPYAGVLFQLIFRLLGRSRADSEEALQETWIRAIERLDGFRFGSSLKTWLCGIAVNCCREHARRSRTGPLELVAEPVDRDREVPERLDLETAIAGLPDGFREVLVLHDVYGYTHEEIAGMSGIDASTSRSQLARARRAVRARLGGAAPERMRNDRTR